jgi:hypothetical protein
MRKLALLLCATTLALAAAGCGTSSGSDGSKDDTTTTEAKATTTADDGSTTTKGGGTDASDITAEQYEAAFATAFSSGSREDGDLVMPKKAAECMAPLTVKALTVEDLHAAGITEEDASDPGFDPSDVGIDEQQARELVDAFSSCDFDIYTELALSLTVGLPDDVQQCAAQNIDLDLADDLMVTSFSSGQSDAQFEALITDLQKSCPDLPSM